MASITKGGRFATHLINEETEVILMEEWEKGKVRFFHLSLPTPPLYLYLSLSLSFLPPFLAPLPPPPPLPLLLPVCRYCRITVSMELCTPVSACLCLSVYFSCMYASLFLSVSVCAWQSIFVLLSVSSRFVPLPECLFSFYYRCHPRVISPVTVNVYAVEKLMCMHVSCIT